MSGLFGGGGGDAPQPPAPSPPPEKVAPLPTKEQAEDTRREAAMAQARRKGRISTLLTKGKTLEDAPTQKKTLLGGNA